MKKNSRIRFNPATKEIEVEGSESFVKTYFDKLQAMISGPAKEKAVKAAPAKKAEIKARVEKAAPVEKVPKAPKAVKPTVAKKKATKTGKKAAAKKKATNIDAVVSLIQGTPEGISTAELKTKTGLNEKQIWSIVNRASKAKKIRKVKRGVYGGVAPVVTEASPEETAA